MSEKHSKRLGLGSFVGAPIFERMVALDHFPVQINRVIDWESFTEILLPCYKGLAESGRRRDLRRRKGLRRHRSALPALGLGQAFDTDPE